MPSRGQVKIYKPRKAEALALCDALYDGRCTCRKLSQGPCSSWLQTFRWCYAKGIFDVLTYERNRIARGERI